MQNKQKKKKITIQRRQNCNLKSEVHNFRITREQIKKKIIIKLSLFFLNTFKHNFTCETLFFHFIFMVFIFR